MTEPLCPATKGLLNSAQCASKVIRAPSLKRGKIEEPMSHRVKLERVLGLTVSTNSGLDCDPSSDTIAYPAGCTVVLFNPAKNRQNHLLNTTRKTVTCVKFSPDGRLLATGENGHLPSVRVWDLADGTQIADFPGHKYGISCVAFSPSQKYLVSVGCEHDMIVNVWEWKSGIKVASNKVSNKVKAVAFSENGSYFVTAGNRLVKFWYLEYTRSAKYKEPVPLMGRSAILGEQRNNDFCDVACGKGEMVDSTYAITKSGLLCEFNNRRLLDKWVELRTSCANCMTVSKTCIFIGCAEGIVRCFSPQTLQYITTLPRPHYLGVDIAQGTNISHTTTHPNNAKYPDTIAVTFDENNMKLTCVYNDHSLYIWDVKDIKRVGKTHSFLYHSACIWGVEMYPDGVKDPAMPLGSFLTCSSDDTIRVWNLDNPDPQTNDTYRTNIYSNELLKVMYVDPEMNFLKDMDITKGEKGDSTSYDGRNGVRSIRVSLDGKHLASGDREGNIRITDLHSLEEMVRIEAHDGEVLCVEYSNSDDPRKNYLASASRDRLIHIFSVEEGYKLVQTLDDHSSSITAVRFLNNNNQLQMVSCGADKSIIFRTLERNSSVGDSQHFGRRLRGRGRRLIPTKQVPLPPAPSSRRFLPTSLPPAQHTFVREQITAAKTTLYDMEVDCTQKHVLTACQDRNIRVYSVNTSKHTKTFKGSVGEDGSLIKVTLDPSGILVATSCTDKTLSIYDYYNTECVATMLGHSELATGLRFTKDCRRLISASGDGCIFVWKMPHDLVVTMRARLAQQVARAGKKLTQLGITLGDNEENDNHQENKINSTFPVSNDSEYRLSMGQLPQWAQKSILDTNLPIIDKSSRSVEAPKGRWAMRAPLEPNYDVPILDRNFYSPGSMSKEKRLDSDGSKEDSSIDSGTELRSFKEKRRTYTIAQVTDIKESILRSGEQGEVTHHRSRHHTDDSSLGSFKYEDLESTEHDGDVEDISEGESVEETRPQLIYYPPAEDTNSDYTVNAMDVEELRKSQRRIKRPDLLLAHGETSQSVSGSQESDDDEQASTPSGEHSDMKFTGSAESLNILTRREKVLNNTFESLSGAEMEKEPSSKNKTSLSSKYMSSTGVRNSNVIQAAKHTKHEAQTTSKREELQRRIEETRRQLQCVGYRSNLESSQSIQDLSPRGMNYHDSRKLTSSKTSVGLQVPNIGKQIDCNTLPQPYKKNPTNKTNLNSERPFTLNLMPDFSIGNVYRKANHTTNLSLPESPVYEDMSSLLCSTDFVKASDLRAKRHSCGFFIDIKCGCSMQSKEDCKSLESLSEVGQSVDISVDEPKSDISDFSSDSLESCAEFPSNKLPRRCVSEYQIFSHGAIQHNEKNKFHSEENILADDVEMMDDNNDELNGRHSSASFFLRSKETCRSTESILTDESEYQYLFTNRDKEEFHSTESILTDVSDSVSKEIPKDISEKQPVFRTRSLQDSTEFKADERFTDKTDSFYSNPNTCPLRENKPKNEFFFIPLGGEGVKTLPDIIAKRFQNKESLSSCQPDTHPIVTHKPPKPHQKTNKSQRKSWQKVSVNTVSKQIAAVKARAAVWKNDEDIKRVWQTDNCSKDPGLNSMRDDLPNKFSNGKPVKSMSLQHIHHIQNEDLVCRELKPLEFIVKEVIIDDISCTKTCDLNNSSNLSNDKNDSSSTCQKVIMSSVDNKTLEEMQKINEVKMNCIYEGKNVNPVNFTKTQTDGGKLRPRMPSVKLLSQNFERISVRNVQDEGVMSGEDNSIARMGYDSGSSTPATSSSCTNSPKRLTNQLAKRFKNNNILPSKCNAVVVDADLSGGIRRSCSLSDLSNTPGKIRALQPAHTATPGKTINLRNSRNTGRHTGAKSSSTIKRSTSVGTLNQSDSESEQSHSQNVRRAMRPTISSLNKAISGQKSSTTNRRRGLTPSYSTMALNKPDNEDSSSEEGKNNRVTQQRSSSTDRTGSSMMGRRSAPGSGLGRYGSERDLTHSQRLASRTFNKPARSPSNMVRSTSNLEDVSAKASYNVDFENTPVPQLLDSMKDHLLFIIEFMNQMQRRLADETVEVSDRNAWHHCFQQTISEHIKSIRRIDPSISETVMTNKIQEALNSLPSDSSSGEMVSMVQQCSDILISMVQKKMSEPKK